MHHTNKYTSLNHPPRVVIIGAGFGGIYAYLGLHKHLHTKSVRVTIINETDSFEFIPMIHEVATGTLGPSHITQSVRTVPQCCIEDFIEGCALRVDLDRGIVFVRQNMEDIPEEYQKIPAHELQQIPYDFLVVANGSETDYLGVSGAREHSMPLKTVTDAKNIKNTLIERFEQAQHLADEKEKRDFLRFVIVGGGPTGVEIAGELGDIIAGELSRAFPDEAYLASVVIIERAQHLLGGLPPVFGKKAERIVCRMPAVYTMLNTTVRSVTPAGVETDKGIVRSRTVIWSAGVMARPLEMSGTQKVERETKTQRIRVNEHLQLASYPNVFVVGDQAYIEKKDSTQPYPMRAQFAVREGKMAAKNIKHLVYGDPLEVFSFKEKGFIISIGKGGALAEIMGIHFSGWPAWVVYRGAYLFALVGWRAKFRTGLSWLLNTFLPRDISKV